MDLLVKEIMTTKLVLVRPNETVINAAKKMMKSGIGNVLIINEGKIEGIITEKDLISKIVLKKLNPETTKVKQIMTKKIITINPESTIQEAASKMVSNDIHRIPVITKGKIIGLITSKDLMRNQPGIIDVLVEKIRNDLPLKSETILTGFCELCNNYSEELITFKGRNLCSKCKKRI